MKRKPKHKIINKNFVLGFFLGLIPAIGIIWLVLPLISEWITLFR